MFTFTFTYNNVDIPAICVLDKQHNMWMSSGKIFETLEQFVPTLRELLGADNLKTFAELEPLHTPQMEIDPNEQFYNLLVVDDIKRKTDSLSKKFTDTVWPLWMYVMDGQPYKAGRRLLSVDSKYMREDKLIEAMAPHNQGKHYLYVHTNQLNRTIDLYEIGCTRSLAKCLSAVNASSPFQVEVIMLSAPHDGPAKFKAIKKAFSKQRVSKNMFKLDSDDLDALDIMFTYANK